MRVGRSDIALYRRTSSQRAPDPRSASVARCPASNKQSTTHKLPHSTKQSTGTTLYYQEVLPGSHYLEVIFLPGSSIN